MKKKLLLVVGMGGPPLDFALPKIADIALLHVLVLMELTPQKLDFFRLYARSVTIMPPKELVDSDLAATIAALGRSQQVAGILTFSEYAIVPVAQACKELGLKGPGSNASASHNKVKMREIWRKAHLLASPRHFGVHNIAELEVAAAALGRPFVLKDANGAGGIGCFLVGQDDELAATYGKAHQILTEAFASSKGDYSNQRQQFELIAEELICGSTEGWYEATGFADFISVEGLVQDGRYFPLTITSRIESLPPFTETGTFAPAPIPAQLEKKVIELAKAAVDALQLENCATHTELKMKPD